MSARLELVGVDSRNLRPSMTATWPGGHPRGYLVTGTPQRDDEPHRYPDDWRRVWMYMRRPGRPEIGLEERELVVAPPLRVQVFVMIAGGAWETSPRGWAGRCCTSARRPCSAGRCWCASGIWLATWKDIP